MIRAASTALRSLALLTSLIATVVAAGDVRARDTLTIGITQYPASMNPSISTMLVASYVLAATQRTLTIDGLDWKPMCVLCEELPTLENGLAETFPSTDRDGAPSTGVRKTYTLKEGLSWADGTPVTVDDVIFGWEVGKHPEAGVATQKAYQDILEIEKVDDRTFTIVDREIDFKYASMGDFEFFQPISSVRSLKWTRRSTATARSTRPTRRTRVCGMGRIGWPRLRLERRKP